MLKIITALLLLTSTVSLADQWQRSLIDNWEHPLFMFKIAGSLDDIYFVYIGLVPEEDYNGNKDNIHVVVRGQNFYFKDWFCYEDIQDADITGLYNR